MIFLRNEKEKKKDEKVRIEVEGRIIEVEGRIIEVEGRIIEVEGRIIEVQRKIIGMVISETVIMESNYSEIDTRIKITIIIMRNKYLKVA